MAQATALREAVKVRFHPYAESQGFARVKSNRITTQFRRIRGQNVHVFDIQWDKYGSPRFVINFGEGPIQGIEVRGQHFPGHSLETWQCLLGGRLQRRRGPYLRDWFHLRKPFLEALRSMKQEYEVEEVVDEVVACFPELESWWANKHEGPHIYVTNVAG